MEKRSRLEYEATAMLLGMYYDDLTNMYVRIPDDFRVDVKYYDADTFAELEHSEATRRSNRVFEDGQRS